MANRGGGILCTRGDCADTTDAVDGVVDVVDVVLVVVEVVVDVFVVVVVDGAALAEFVDDSGAPSSRTNSRGTQPRLLPKLNRRRHLYFTTTFKYHLSALSTTRHR